MLSTYTCAIYHQEADDEILSLQERLAVYNLESSGEKSQGKFYFFGMNKCVLNHQLISDACTYKVHMVTPSIDVSVFFHSLGRRTPCAACWEETD